MSQASISYRGRLAPSPTGLLHIGHARTFWIAAQRATEHQGTLILRNEDLDPQRSRPEFADAMIEDLHWLGIRWSEGPDRGGPYVPYLQSERRAFYLDAWRQLRDRASFILAPVRARIWRKRQARPTMRTTNPFIRDGAVGAPTHRNSPVQPESTGAFACRRAMRSHSPI